MITSSSELYQLQVSFHKSYAEDSSLTGTVMRELVGRVISFGVTLLLHAQAVCMAVAACFNNIRSIFSMTNEELLRVGDDHKFGPAKVALGRSWKSFEAIFNRSVLKEEEPGSSGQESISLASEPQPAAPREMASSQEAEDSDDEPLSEMLRRSAKPVSATEPLNVVEPAHFAMPPMAAPVPVAAQPLPRREVKPLKPLNFEDLPLNVVEPAHFAMPPMAAPVPVAAQPLSRREITPLVPLHFADRLLNVVEPAHFAMPSMKEPVPVAAQPLSRREAKPLVPLHFADLPLNVVEPAHFKMPPMAAPVPPQAGNMEIDLPSPIGARLEHQPGTFSGSKEEGAILRLDRNTVVRTLGQKNTQAATRLSLPPKNIEFRSGELAGGKISKGTVGGYPIGGCHFGGAIEHFASTLELRRVGAPLMGMFEPQGNNPATATFLRANFLKALQNHLNFHNQGEWSPDGIYRGISLAFLQLDRSFRQKFPQLVGQPSSLTVVLELDGHLWIINMGNSRAALSNRGEAVQCTSNEIQGFGSQVSMQPEITCYELAKIGADSHLIIGSRALFANVGTTKLVGWTHQYRTLSMEELARNIVHSVSRVTRDPLSCFVMSLNNHEWEFV